MMLSHNINPVVVGIDGSTAALHAAQWAVDEALSRDVPLRLVSCSDQEAAVALTDDQCRLNLEYAQTCLRAAQAAIDATGRPVKVETAVLQGRPDSNLVEESRQAAMICVGSVGIGRFAKSLIGSTAATVAEHAHCPVAIIRSHPTHQAPHAGMIAVPVGVSGDDDHIIDAAVAEAELRGRPVLAVGIWERDFGGTPYDELDRRMARSQESHPDVRIHITTGAAGICQFLAEHTEPVDLVVLGAADAAEVTNIVGPHKHFLAGHPGCSVLVVRP
jgi:nucleotide-binding universal stress UspA family protein